MKTTLSLVAMLLATSACTPPVSKDALAPLDGALQAVQADVASTIDTEARAEALARRNEAIREGRPPYRLLPGCAADDITLIGAPMSAEDREAFRCAYEEVDPKGRGPSNAEVAGQVLDLLADYVSELNALAQSDLPEKIDEAVAGLLTSTADLATAVGQDVTGSRLLGQPTTAGRLARFGLEQYRAHVLRRAVADARAPVDQAVRLVVSYLLEEGKGRDPVVQTSARLLEADAAMQLTPGNPAIVAEFEAAFAANEAARNASPAVRMMRVLAAHEALADRLSGPATVEELTALVDELAELRRLIQTD
jgi:hypothetical protein